MPKTPKTFRTVTFDWMIPTTDRQQVEDTLRQLGYEVDGGGTDLTYKNAHIYIRPRARTRTRKPRPVGITVE